MPPIEIAFHHERPINAQAVRELYTSVDWWPMRTTEEIAQVLENALAVGAWEGVQLVGFVRVISDQRFHAYIEDMVVHPDHQQRGIGKLLLTKLLDRLSHFETVTLFCHRFLLPFYEEFGFQAFPSQVVMHRRRSIPGDNERDH